MTIDISSKETLYSYNLYHVVKAFFPNAEIRQKVDERQEPLAELVLEEGSCFSIPGSEVRACLDRQEAKHHVTKLIYEYLSKETGKKLAWGMLTGIRPTKLIMQMIENGISDKEIVKFLNDTYSVSMEKAVLGCEIARREKELLQKVDYDRGYSLYIGIPFCPSICSYCSFGSSPLDRWADRMDLYVDALCKEIAFIGQAARGKRLNTIYIGGGTPTSLEAEQLERLLNLLDSTFSYEYLQEFTVEAGRPDTITREKLEVLAKHPVTRISINPQTMQQKTLDEVGRCHTVQEVKDVFYLARELGFDNINMDLIAGLPGEDAVDMQDTLQQIESLRPDSLTIHALAIKRAAKFGQEHRRIDLHSEIAQMVEAGADAAKRMGLQPYYLYRQKNMAGNFENVGYAKVDKAGIYNILIMEEKQTILAAGAGASTKIVFPDKITLENGKQSNLVRIENVKDIESYIRRIDEMIERKGAKWLWH
ncbi:coproporphyrinogen dehydrogenase HemZ [Clostridium sp. C105KSO13]|uniref:coproporphyrinogen dehydrogenase HemZ n=1 Tax=Clostridium sp. C105KSO13 TaxID=1776045 RepID=UPI0007407451|nr:coproporphyrinogen dehydrogenase HemZ [Clostridium sp. C105KSO13]CUX38900.1 Oxygen-independent coproporphyrinogen-III oxidase 2 [Clostridium sp. C105KSO13]